MRRPKPISAGERESQGHGISGGGFERSWRVARTPTRSWRVCAQKQRRQMDRAHADPGELEVAARGAAVKTARCEDGPAMAARGGATPLPPQFLHGAPWRPTLWQPPAPTSPPSGLAAAAARLASTKSFSDLVAKAWLKTKQDRPLGEVRLRFTKEHDAAYDFSPEFAWQCPPERETVTGDLPLRRSRAAARRPSPPPPRAGAARRRADGGGGGGAAARAARRAARARAGAGAVRLQRLHRAARPRRRRERRARAPNWSRSRRRWCGASRRRCARWSRT